MQNSLQHILFTARSTPLEALKSNYNDLKGADIVVTPSAFSDLSDAHVNAPLHKPNTNETIKSSLLSL